VGSQKYLTVLNGQDANGANVNQLTSSGTESQQFKIIYDHAVSAYRFFALCSNKGSNRVLDIVKNQGQVDDGCNVEIYTPTDPVAQLWELVVVGGAYKVVPQCNTAVGLTANGYGDGDNVLVSTYDATDLQHWEFVPAETIGLLLDLKYWCQTSSSPIGTEWCAGVDPTILSTIAGEGCAIASVAMCAYPTASVQGHPADPYGVYLQNGGDVTAGWYDLGAAYPSIQYVSRPELARNRQGTVEFISERLYSGELVIIRLDNNCTHWVVAVGTRLPAPPYDYGSMPDEFWENQLIIHDPAQGTTKGQQFIPWRDNSKSATLLDVPRVVRYNRL